MEKIQKLLFHLNKNWVVEVYHSHFQLYDQERSLEIGKSYYSIPQLEEALENAMRRCALFSIDGYFKDDKTKFENYLVTSWDSIPEGLEDEEIFYFGLNADDLAHSLTTGGDDALEFVVTEIRFLDI